MCIVVGRRVVRSVCLCEQNPKLIDEPMGEQRDRRVHRWIDGWTYAYTDEWMDRQIDGWMIRVEVDRYIHTQVRALVNSTA